MSDERCMVCGLPVMECLQGITKFLLAQQQEEDYPPQAIPDTARRILDIGRTQQAAQQPVDERAAGVARAVANLSNHEHRLGAARFQP
jgi:hypothetical protein